VQRFMHGVFFQTVEVRPGHSSQTLVHVLHFDRAAMDTVLRTRTYEPKRAFRKSGNCLLYIEAKLILWLYTCTHLYLDYRYNRQNIIKIKTYHFN